MLDVETLQKHLLTRQSCLLQVILMDHVDWLDEAAASLLATRLAEQVLVHAVSSRANMCLVLSIGLLVLCSSVHILSCKLDLCCESGTPTFI